MLPMGFRMRMELEEGELRRISVVEEEGEKDMRRVGIRMEVRVEVRMARIISNIRIQLCFLKQDLVDIHLLNSTGVRRILSTLLEPLYPRPLHLPRSIIHIPSHLNIRIPPINLRILVTMGNSFLRTRPNTIPRISISIRNSNQWTDILSNPYIRINIHIHLITNNSNMSLFHHISSSTRRFSTSKQFIIHRRILPIILIQITMKSLQLLRRFRILLRQL